MDDEVYQRGYGWCHRCRGNVDLWMWVLNSYHACFDCGTLIANEYEPESEPEPEPGAARYGFCLECEDNVRLQFPLLPTSSMPFCDTCGSSRIDHVHPVVTRLPQLPPTPRTVTVPFAVSLASLPVVAAPDPDAVCAVCFESLGCQPVSDGGPATGLTCGHVFHSDCIEPWLGQRNSCPLCRQPALPEDSEES